MIEIGQNDTEKIVGLGPQVAKNRFNEWYDLKVVQKKSDVPSLNDFIYGNN